MKVSPKTRNVMLAVGIPVAVGIAAFAAGRAVAQGPAATNLAGGPSVGIVLARETAAFIASGPAWTDVPGANLGVTVPAGTSYTLVAEFFAESMCFRSVDPEVGGAGSVRVVAVNGTTGAALELNPNSGLDFGFDSLTEGIDGDNSTEGHATQRSVRLSTGNWRLKVQARTTDAGTSLWLDDWSFSVQSFK